MRMRPGGRFALNPDYDPDPWEGTVGVVTERCPAPNDSLFTMMITVEGKTSTVMVRKEDVEVISTNDIMQ